MAPASHRFIAIQILRRVLQRESVLDREFQNPAFQRLDSKDRRFATELVYGTLRRLKTLDFFIERISNRPIGRIDPEILWILRTGLYQLAWMRAPARAVVNEAVDLCRAFRKSSAAGFVNAALRRFTRQRPAAPAGDTVAEAAVRFSHPEWLVEACWARFGRQATIRMMQRNNRPPEQWIWINPFRTERRAFLERLRHERIRYLEHPELTSCVRVDSPSFIFHPLYRDGACFLMDPSSQKIAQMVPVKERERIADLCAAPGGKSFILASRRKDLEPILCADSNNRRLLDLKSRARLYGIPNLQLVQADASHALPLNSSFDSLLLDVPCSGLGTIRRNPDIRWTFQPSGLARLHQLQLEILQEGFRVLRANGALIYSTCSILAEENEETVERFLADTPEARLEGDFFRSFPDSPYDGFFAARIRRR